MTWADSFFFIAHDDRACKRRLHTVTTGPAATLLGELVVWNAIDIQDGSPARTLKASAKVPQACAVLDWMVRPW